MPNLRSLPGDVVSRGAREVVLFLALSALGPASCARSHERAAPAIASGALPSVSGPTPAPRPPPVTAIAVRSCRGYAIRAPGTLWTWGRKRAAPALADPRSDWVVIRTSAMRDCGIRADGSLWCMNRQSLEDLRPFEQITFRPTWRDVAISAEGYTVFGVDGDGTLWQWGMVGDGSHQVELEQPVKVAGGPYAHVVFGRWRLCALTESRKIACRGFDDGGPIGQGFSRNPRALTTTLGDYRWVAVSANDDDTCAITDKGELYCWGSFGCGWTDVPKRLGTDTDWEKVSGSGCALKHNGSLWCWGVLAPAEAHMDKLPCPGTPAPIRPGESWTAVSFDENPCAVRNDGTAWCNGTAKDNTLLGSVNPGEENFFELAL